MNIYEDINSLELNEMIKNKEKFILLDVRTEEEYEASHIPNAINIPFNICVLLFFITALF